MGTQTQCLRSTYTASNREASTERMTTSAQQLQTEYCKNLNFGCP